MVQTHSAGSAATDTFQLLAHWLAFGLGCVAFFRGVAADAFDGLCDFIAFGGEELVLVLEELPILATLIKVSHVVAEYGFVEVARALGRLCVERIRGTDKSYKETTTSKTYTQSPLDSCASDDLPAYDISQSMMGVSDSRLDEGLAEKGDISPENIHEVKLTFRWGATRLSVGFHVQLENTH